VRVLRMQSGGFGAFLARGAWKRERNRKLRAWKIALVAALAAGFLFADSSLFARTNILGRTKDTAPYGEGLIMNVPFSENEVAAVVKDVVGNGIIRGTKEYNKDEFVSGAEAASSVSAKIFPTWTGGGQIFYKVKNHALDPRNFKDGSDMGTLAVRYIVQAQGEKNSVVHINAVFVEDIRRTAHQSNGSVESAEFKDIHDRLDQIAVMKAETEEIAREHEEKRSGTSSPQVSSSRPAGSEAPSAQTSSMPQATAQLEQAAPQARQQAALASDASTSAASTSRASTPDASTPGSSLGDAQMPTPAVETAANAETTPRFYTGANGAQTPEEHVKELRRQLERLVKAPGGALRSAPFHTASTLQSLPPGTEVLIVITTPYWFGIETHDGQHGWMLRDDLEMLP
jgi:hypothetical protein